VRDKFHIYGWADKKKTQRTSVKTQIQRVSLLRKLCVLYLTLTRIAVCSLYGKITKINVFRVSPLIKCLADRRTPVFFSHFRSLPESKIHIFFICKRRALETLHVGVLHESNSQISVAISYYLQNSGIYNTVLCTQHQTRLRIGRSALCIQYSPSLGWKLTHDHFKKRFLTCCHFKTK
jgi:hypothetical protein